jgi:hypothetical protein
VAHDTSIKKIPRASWIDCCSLIALAKDFAIVMDKNRIILILIRFLKNIRIELTDSESTRFFFGDKCIREDAILLPFVDHYRNKS